MLFKTVSAFLLWVSVGRIMLSFIYNALKIIKSYEILMAFHKTIQVHLLWIPDIFRAFSELMARPLKYIDKH